MLLPEDADAQNRMIQGLVDSLCSLEGVEQVQLMLDGEYMLMLGSVPISRPLLPSSAAETEEFSFCLLQKRGNVVLYPRAPHSAGRRRQQEVIIMNNETKHGKYTVQDLVRISVLVAIMLLLEVTGLGMIKMPGLEITLLMVPVIVGAIVMGPATGAILGGVFGCISFWECFGKSQFGAVLLGINPLYTFLVCVPTRILAGWLCGLSFKGLNKLDKSNLWSFGAAGLIGALCNTVLFMSMLCLCFYHTEYIQGFVAALGSSNAFLFVIAFVGVNGLVEGAVSLITGAAIAKAVMYSRGKLAARRTAVQNGK